MKSKAGNTPPGWKIEILKTVPGVIIRIPKRSAKMRKVEDHWQYPVYIKDGTGGHIDFYYYGLTLRDMGKEIIATVVIKKRSRQGEEFVYAEIRKETSDITNPLNVMNFFQRESDIPIPGTGICIHFSNFIP